MNEYITIKNDGKYYYKDKEKTILHREDGPAIEYIGGGKSWYRNGVEHRTDGPAHEWWNGEKEYWINDNFIFGIDHDGNVYDRMR